MKDRLVISPVYGQAWFFSACATDALVQAATLWDCPFGELLDEYRAGRVKVKVRKTEV